MPGTTFSLPSASLTSARITGASLVLAPALLLASTVGYIAEGNGINDGFVGGTIGVWSCLAFLLAIAGLVRAIEPHARRAAPILMSVTLIGCAAGVGFNIDGVLAAEFGRDAVDAVTEDHAFVVLAYLPWGLLFPVGLIGTGVLAWRTRALPRRTAAFLAVGGALFVSSRPARVEPLALVGDAALVVALLPVGWSLLLGGHRAAPSAEPAMTPAV